MADTVESVLVELQDAVVRREAAIEAARLASKDVQAAQLRLGAARNVNERENENVFRLQQALSDVIVARKGSISIKPVFGGVGAEHAMVSGLRSPMRAQIEEMALRAHQELVENGSTPTRCYVAVDVWRALRQTMASDAVALCGCPVTEDCSLRLGTLVFLR